MNRIIFISSGLCMNELYEFFECNPAGFADPDPFWSNEIFAEQKSEIAVYEMFLKKERNISYLEQKKQIPQGYTIPSAALLAECILGYYRKTKKRLMSNWYARTSSFMEDGGRTCIGYFDKKGLQVLEDCEIPKYTLLGIAYIKKLKDIQTSS